MRDFEVKKAVALKYPKGADIPFISAKGKGELAEKILEIAREKNIHIEQNSELVDFLSGAEIGDLIPEETWEILAKIFSLILNSENI